MIVGVADGMAELHRKAGIGFLSDEMGQTRDSFGIILDGGRLSRGDGIAGSDDTLGATKGEVGCFVS